MLSIVTGLILLALLLGFPPSFQPALAEDAGKFTLVINQVDHLKKGQEPAAQAKVHDGVAVQDAVRTAEQSRARVQFVDATTMTVAPKSKVTIEEYMYDAKQGKSKGVIQLIDGVMETVTPPGGQPEVIIKTSTAIAGIRG